MTVDRYKLYYIVEREKKMSKPFKFDFNTQLEINNNFHKIKNDLAKFFNDNKLSIRGFILDGKVVIDFLVDYYEDGDPFVLKRIEECDTVEALDIIK